MMEWMKEWIVGVTAASVLLATVKTMIPKGSIKQVGEFACGLILLLAVAAPLTELDEGSLSLALTEFRMADWESSELLKLENTELIKEIIDEKTCAYISDKAKELGMDCTAEVDYEYSDDGFAYPVSVRIRGSWTDTQRSQLTAFLESELVISKDNQTYERVNAP